MTITHLITAGELESMGSNARFELFQGVLHEMSPSSYQANIVLARIGTRLFTFAESHGLGQVTFAESGFTLERDPDTVVAPDVAFVARDRVSLAGDTGYFPGHPDLIVEVISPTDESREIRQKQALYDRVGVPLVWWIDPRRRTATVHAVGQPVRQIAQDGHLDGESVVPGFSIKLADLFNAPK